MARADFNRVATVYDAGRSLPDESMEGWRKAIARYLPARSGLIGLDLGCGTGRFTSALATWFDAEIIGVDPASEMLGVAENESAHERVSYLLARAESLPSA